MRKVLNLKFINYIINREKNIGTKKSNCVVVVLAVTLFVLLFKYLSIVYIEKIIESQDIFQH